MNLFYQPDIPNDVLFLEPEESRHCIKVLRKRAGDTIQITDGKGSFYSATIEKADASKCTFSILTHEEVAPLPFSIHIAISPTKNADRIEWFVEKATEFGIDEISLIDCDHTERTFIKKERLEKVAVSAMKQSVKARLPIIHELRKFKAVVDSVADQKFIAFVDHTNPLQLQQAALPKKRYLILVGPEGDFSLEELALTMNNGFQKVSLGQSRLRTETAGLAACHILNLVNS